MMRLYFDIENIRDSYKSYLIPSEDKNSMVYRFYEVCEQADLDENQEWLKNNAERFYVSLCPNLSESIMATIKPLQYIHDAIAKECPINFMVTGFHTAADVVYYANCFLERANVFLFSYVNCMELAKEKEDGLSYQERLARHTECIRRLNNINYYGYSKENDISSYFTVNYWFDRFEKLYNFSLSISKELSAYVNDPYMAEELEFKKFIQSFK